MRVYNEAESAQNKARKPISWYQLREGRGRPSISQKHKEVFYSDAERGQCQYRLPREGVVFAIQVYMAGQQPLLKR